MLLIQIVLWFMNIDSFPLYIYIWRVENIRKKFQFYSWARQKRMYVKTVSSYGTTLSSSPATTTTTTQSRSVLSSAQWEVVWWWCVVCEIGWCSALARLRQHTSAPHFCSHLAAVPSTTRISTCHKENINKVPSCFRIILQKWMILTKLDC